MNSYYIPAGTTMWRRNGFDGTWEEFVSSKAVSYNDSEVWTPIWADATSESITRNLDKLGVAGTPSFSFQSNLKDTVEVAYFSLGKVQTNESNFRLIAIRKTGIKGWK